MPVAADLLVHLRRSRDRIDRCYADPLDLATLASVAGVSKFHFQRCFTDVYGRSPTDYLTRRRIERAQDLLRHTNLTVTEVCQLVGYASLGSFSSRFSALVGCSPSRFQAGCARTEAPRIPGCWIFMRGLDPQSPTRAP